MLKYLKSIIIISFLLIIIAQQLTIHNYDKSIKLYVQGMDQYTLTIKTCGQQLEEDSKTMSMASKYIDECRQSRVKYAADLLNCSNHQKTYAK